MAYVDLNPVRAELAERIEEIRYTSIYERLQENSAEALTNYLRPVLSGIDLRSTATTASGGQQRDFGPRGTTPRSNPPTRRIPEFRPEFGKHAKTILRGAGQVSHRRRHRLSYRGTCAVGFFGGPRRITVGCPAIRGSATRAEARQMVKLVVMGSSRCPNSNYSHFGGLG